jgi:hypothetical protein
MKSTTTEIVFFPVALFAKDLGASFPIMLDPAGIAKKAFDLPGALPVTLILDGQAVVRHRIVGATTGVPSAAKSTPCWKKSRSEAHIDAVSLVQNLTAPLMKSPIRIFALIASFCFAVTARQNIRGRSRATR